MGAINDLVFIKEKEVIIKDPLENLKKLGKEKVLK